MIHYDRMWNTHGEQILQQQRLAQEKKEKGKYKRKPQDSPSAYSYQNDVTQNELEPGIFGI